MGLLPDAAKGLNVTIPEAGHLISIYALGVVIGAPLLAILGARASRRNFLMTLMGLFALGNLLSAVVPGYPAMLVARFLAGFPHGTFFGVAALVAAGLVERARAGGVDGAAGINHRQSDWRTCRYRHRPVVWLA